MTAQRAPKSLVRLASAALAVGALTLATACGDDESTEKPTATTVATTEAAAPEFAGQWARTSPAAATMGAAYLTITSPVDDVLLGVAVDATIAAEAQMHEMVMAEMTGTTMSMGTGMGSETTMPMGEGEMVMQQVDSIDLPAGVAVELKPGGYHIMLIDLVNPLEVGTTIQITLTFQNAGEITLDFPVLDEAP